MKINYACLPCLVNQVVRVAEITNASEKGRPRNET